MRDIVNALIGALIGGLFSLLGTWLTLRGRTDYFDDLALNETKQLIFIAKCSLGQIDVDSKGNG